MSSDSSSKPIPPDTAMAAYAVLTGISGFVGSQVPKMGKKMGKPTPEKQVLGFALGSLVGVLISLGLFAVFKNKMKGY